MMEEKTTEYSTRMQLHIKDFQESDVGVYTCISTNSLGKSEGTIRLYEIPSAERPTAGPPRATTLIQQTGDETSGKFVGGMLCRRRGNMYMGFEEEEKGWCQTYLRKTRF